MMIVLEKVEVKVVYLHRFLLLCVALNRPFHVFFFKRPITNNTAGKSVLHFELFVFVKTFSVLTRWLRNFEMNYSYHSAAMRSNPILLVVNIFFYEISH